MTELCTETVNDELLMATYNNSRSNRSTRRQTSQPKKICAKEERNASIKKVRVVYIYKLVCWLVGCTKITKGFPRSH